jgi:hypothetical protein
MIEIMEDDRDHGTSIREPFSVRPDQDRVRRDGGKPPFPRRIRRVNRVGRERRISLYYVASPIRL